MTLFKSILDAFKRDKTYVIVALVTFILLFIHIKTHRWQQLSPADSAAGSLISTAQLPDFSTIEPVSARKSAFFNYIRPVVRQENMRIRYDRAFIESIAGNIRQDNYHQNANLRKLQRIAKRYHYEIKDVNQAIEQLLLQVDVIPEALVLVQAANESAWGTSRFARQANNLFGQWCYTAGCGLVPKNRNKGAKHEVRKFDSPKASIVSYMRNLNSHAAYKEFRQIRSQLKRNNRKVTAIKLAQGLLNYSERREAYVHELVEMIKQNNLE